MASSGPNSAGTIVNDATIGTIAWINPSDAVSSNDVRSHADGIFPFGYFDSNYLKATNFGFALGGGDTIDGIKVEVEKRSDFANLTLPIDLECKIVKGGSIGTVNKASGANWTTSDAVTTYGGAADLWGLTWNPSDINDSTFGFVISARAFADNKYGPPTVSIDHVKITVYYTASGGGGSVSKLGLLGVG